MYKKSLSHITVFIWDITANMFSETKGKQYLYAQSFLSPAGIASNACSHWLLGCPIFSHHHHLHSSHDHIHYNHPYQFSTYNEPVFISIYNHHCFYIHAYIYWLSLLALVSLKLVSDCLFIRRKWY